MKIPGGLFVIILEMCFPSVNDAGKRDWKWTKVPDNGRFHMERQYLCWPAGMPALLVII
jgi:hypothetical protein